jgi:hypothetical protein
MLQYEGDCVEFQETTGILDDEDGYAPCREPSCLHWSARYNLSKNTGRSMIYSLDIF